MSSVYYAEHLTLLQPVALKVLKQDFARSDLVRERLCKEARFLARLRSPHTVRVLDACTRKSECAYIAMEYVPGRSLSEYVSDNPNLDPSLVLEIALQICHSLSEAHAVGVVHRDVKPENILLEAEPPDVKVRLIDFGIAKDLSVSSGSSQTIRHAKLGTPGYMAPEQFLDSTEVDARADVFSVGVLLFELLTGKLPFVELNDGGLSAWESSVRLDHENPEVDSALADIVERCIRFQPRERYASASELKLALEAVRESKASVPATRTGADTEKSQRMDRRSLVGTLDRDDEGLDSPSIRPMIIPPRATGRPGALLSTLAILTLLVIAGGVHLDLGGRILALGDRLLDDDAPRRVATTNVNRETSPPSMSPLAISAHTALSTARVAGLSTDVSDDHRAEDSPQPASADATSETTTSAVAPFRQSAPIRTRSAAELTTPKSTPQRIPPTAGSRVPSSDDTKESPTNQASGTPEPAEPTGTSEPVEPSEPAKPAEPSHAPEPDDVGEPTDSRDPTDANEPTKPGADSPRESQLDPLDLPSDPAKDTDPASPSE